LKRNRRNSCPLQTIYFRDHSLYLEMMFPRLQNIDEMAFTLLFVERYTTKKIPYSLSVVHNNGILQACLTEMDLRTLLMEGKDWDVYVTLANDPSSERIRVNSQGVELEPFFFLHDNEMLTPFTTNNGNLSFKSQSPDLITKVEQIDFIHKDRIRIKGYVVHPLWDPSSTLINSTLMFSTNDDNGTIFKAPLKVVDDLKSTRYGDHDVSPVVFEGIVPIEVLLSKKGEDQTFKLRIELSYFKGSKKEDTESPPLKLKTPKFSKKYLIKTIDGKKKRISISRTKKARQLTITITPYAVKNNAKARVKETLLFIKRHRWIKELYKKVFHLLGRLPADKKVVVFESFLGKQFSDNPRAIYEYLQHQYRDSYKLYWSVDKRFLHNFQDKNLNCIRRFSIKWLWIMPRARYWVTNSRMPLWIPKPKHTTYLQTWHGTPLKRLAADMDEVYMPGTTAENYKKNFIKEAKNWDYLISPNAYSTEIFRRAFQFDKEVLETGYPRNDFICNHNNRETIERLRSEYGIPLDKKVILYAPTWRDNQFYGKGQYRFDLHLDLDLMKEKLSEDYVVLFRLHYLVAENLDLTSYKGFAYDFSNLEDIRELYVLSDLLITDYSSVFFDFGNVKRPMIFYVYDIEEYRDNLRGFYFDFEKEAPGPLVKTTDEVIQAIKEIEKEGFQLSRRFEQFYDQFCYLESGVSTRKVVEKLFLNEKGEQVL
jgi:CDP-glycerol glycerophosphotransferase